MPRIFSVEILYIEANFRTRFVTRYSARKVKKCRRRGVYAKSETFWYDFRPKSYKMRAVIRAGFHLTRDGDHRIPANQASELIQPVLQPLADEIGKTLRQGENHFGLHAGQGRQRQDTRHGA